MGPGHSTIPRVEHALRLEQLQWEHNVEVQEYTHAGMMLVCCVFMTNAKWNLKPIEQTLTQKTIKLCDGEGVLCLTAVAATENGKELVQLINDGLDCKVLS